MVVAALKLLHPTKLVFVQYYFLPPYGSLKLNVLPDFSNENAPYFIPFEQKNSSIPLYIFVCVYPCVYIFSCNNNANRSVECVIEQQEEVFCFFIIFFIINNLFSRNKYNSKWSLVLLIYSSVINFFIGIPRILSVL